MGKSHITLAEARDEATEARSRGQSDKRMPRPDPWSFFRAFQIGTLYLPRYYELNHVKAHTSPSVPSLFHSLCSTFDLSSPWLPLHPPHQRRHCPRKKKSRLRSSPLPKRPSPACAPSLLGALAAFVRSWSVIHSIWSKYGYRLPRRGFIRELSMWYGGPLRAKGWRGYLMIPQA